MKTCPLILASLLTWFPDASGVTSVVAYNSAGTELRNHAGVPLRVGTSLPNDGDVFQLGYFTSATEADPFGGAWVTLMTRAIGEKGPGLGPGLFSISETLSPALIVAGRPMAIRFYDASSVEDAGWFNTVTNLGGGWDMESAADTRITITITLSDSGLVWQGGPDSAFRTAIPVPEPVTTLLLPGGLVFLALRRRREGNYST